MQKRIQNKQKDKQERTRDKIESKKNKIGDKKKGRLKKIENKERRKLEMRQCQMTMINHLPHPRQTKIEEGKKIDCVIQISYDTVNYSC